MKLTIDIKTLLAAINRAKPVASGATTPPVLSCFLLTATDKLTIAANNLDLFISTDAECNVSEQGSVCISARRFAEVIAALGSGEVEISADAKRFVSIRRGASFVKLAGLPDAEFPPVGKQDWGRHVSLTQAKLGDAIGKTLPFASTDATRYILNGIALDGSDKMTAIAADGKRVRSFPLGEDFKGKTVVIPTAAAKLIASLCEGEGGIQLSFSDNAIRAQADEWSAIAKLIEGNFPNWRQVIPGECKIEATGSREALLDAISIAELTSNREAKIPVVNFCFDRNLSTVSSKTAAVGDALIEIAGMVATKKLAISFDPARLRELLRSFSSESITLEFEDEMAPLKIQDETGTAVLMCCRMA